MRQTPIEALRDVRPMYEGEAVAKLGRFLIPYAAAYAADRQAERRREEPRAARPADARRARTACCSTSRPTTSTSPRPRCSSTRSTSSPARCVVVSHDRYFLDRVVDRIFEVRDGELHVYEGGYSYYAEQVARH